MVEQSFVLPQRVEAESQGEAKEAALCPTLRPVSHQRKPNKDGGVSWCTRQCDLGPGPLTEIWDECEFVLRSEHSCIH